MEIGLIRVDSRLIHGQVITKWLNYSKANVIVVVDDELSKDSFMSEIYKASAPNGIIVEILSIDDFMKNTGTHKYNNKRLLILLKNIETVYELYLRQFKMEHIQLGGLPSGVGKKAIYKAIFLNEEEINKLRDIANSGVYIDMQVIPEDTKSDLMKAINRIGVETDRDNANVGNNFSSKLLRIASESNKWHNLANMPKHLAKAHENGELYFHDLDSYNLSINCLHIPTKEILENGFNTGYGTINKPKRIETAAELSCILLQSSQNDMFGGQAHPDFDNDMSIFIDPTRQEIRSELEALGIEEERIENIVEERLKMRVHQAMQGIVYNLNTMHSRAGQ